MSVLKKKRSLSKAEFINVAHEIYIETIDFLTKTVGPVFPAYGRANRQTGR